MRLRQELSRNLADAPSSKGSILDALMRAPPDVAELDFTRERDKGRDIAVWVAICSTRTSSAT